MFPSSGVPVVLHVVGKGRSGSTLLDTVLGQVPGVVSTGELRYLWEWGVQGGYRCGCGRPVVACPLWSTVLEGLGKRVPWASDPNRAGRVVDDALRWPRVPGTVMAARGGRVPDRLVDFVELYAALYREIVAVSGDVVVVDSSKWPAHPALLGLVSGVRPIVVHLVRDPRGVANSYRMGKATEGDQPDMPQFGPVHTALSWTARNLVSELLPRTAPGIPVVRLRYEDFVTHPMPSLRRILDAAGLEGVALDVVQGDVVTVAPTHTVGGNPGRFTTGPITLRPDRRWHEHLPDRDRRVVEVLTSPLRRRYGYGREGA